MIDRRHFLLATGGGLALSMLPLRSRWAHAAAIEQQLPVLRESPYVYISPLKTNGEESRCHAELWYAWIDSAVVVTVSSDRWKATAISRGLERARIWVGDYGRVSGDGGEAFRKGPSFVVRGQALKNDALMERLLTEYGRKYPKEIGRWRDRMRAGYADGSRTLLRYSILT